MSSKPFKAPTSGAKKPTLKLKNLKKPDLGKKKKMTKPDLNTSGAGGDRSTPKPSLPMKQLVKKVGGGKPLLGKKGPLKPSFKTGNKDALQIGESPASSNPASANPSPAHGGRPMAPKKPVINKIHAQGPLQLKNIRKHDVSNIKSRPNEDSDDSYDNSEFGSDTEVDMKPLKSNKKITSNAIKFKAPNLGQRLDIQKKDQESGFAAQKKIVVAKQEVRIDSEAENKQFPRAENLREILHLDTQEFDNCFSLQPQTPNDLYFDKLKTHQIQSVPVQSNDDNVDREIGTDEIETAEAFNQYPEDVGTNYWKMKKQELGQTHYDEQENKQKAASNLEKLLTQATPVFDEVLTENVELADLIKPKASTLASHSLKARVAIPQRILGHLGVKSQKLKATATFDSAPMVKTAAAFELEREDGSLIHLVGVFFLSNGQPFRFLVAPDPITSICAPLENRVVVGTSLGTLCLYDLSETTNISATLPNLVEANETIKFYEPTFSTDGLDDPIHYSSIMSLKGLVKKGSSRVAAIDESGQISIWVLITLKEGDYAGSIADLTLNIGGKSKLALSAQVSIAEKLRLGFDPSTVEIDFHPGDKNAFVFSTEYGLFYSKVNKASGETFATPQIRELDTSPISQNSRCTTLSFSDMDFILAGFSDGSIAVFHAEYSSPLSIWYSACKVGVKQINWCSIYFTEGKRQTGYVESRIADRLCEFVVIDDDLQFYIWNLTKDIHKHVHTIGFPSNDLKSLIDPAHLNLTQISKTAADQTFNISLSLSDSEIAVYLMNFKKGKPIT